MSYFHIPDLYKDQTILRFRECYALEKIDGTSAHVSWTAGAPEKERLKFFSGGASHKVFCAIFDAEKLAAAFTALGLASVIVYGEFYGGRIQGQSKRYGTVQRFVAFDVAVKGLWLDVPSAVQIVEALGLEFVPYVKCSTDLEVLDGLRDAPSMQAVRNGIETDQSREGIVLRTLFEVRLNDDRRIIAKYRRNEERETATVRTIDDPAKLAVLTSARAIAEEWVTEMRLTHVLSKQPEATSFEAIPAVISAMVEDVTREGAGEIVVTREAVRAIG